MEEGVLECVVWGPPAREAVGGVVGGDGRGGDGRGDDDGGDECDSQSMTVRWLRRAPSGHPALRPPSPRGLR